MRVVGIGIVAALAIGVIYVWNSSWQNLGESEPSVEPKSQAQNSTMAGTDPVAEVSSTETDKINPSNTEPSNIDSTEPSDIDPSDIVENSQNPDSEVLDPVVDTEALSVEESAANTNQNVVEIPAGGYPVEDSMKYYVPKNARTAGNLGGPPPPPFMVPENAQGERNIEALLPPAPEVTGQ